MKLVTRGRLRFVPFESTESVNWKAATQVDLCTAGEWPSCLLFLSHPVYIWGYFKAKCCIAAWYPSRLMAFQPLTYCPLFCCTRSRGSRSSYFSAWGHICRGAWQHPGLRLMGYLLDGRLVITMPFLGFALLEETACSSFCQSCQVCDAFKCTSVVTHYMSVNSQARVWCKGVTSCTMQLTFFSSAWLLFLISNSPENGQFTTTYDKGELITSSINYCSYKKKTKKNNKSLSGNG